MNPWLDNTRPLRYGLIILGGLGGVLLFVLASASGNSHFFDEHYPLLISLNAAIALGLLLILLVLIRRVFKRYRAGVFGSRLMLRMSLSFALMGLVPGLLLYVVSVQFLAKSIESWFDVRVDGALESGLNLGQAALDSLVKELSIKGQSISLELSRTTPSQQLLELSRLRETAHVQELTLLSETGQMIGSSGGSIDSDSSLGNALGNSLNSSLLPSLPTPTMLRQALVTRPFQQIEPGIGSNSAQLTIRIVVPIAPPLINLDPGQRYVQILQPVPLTLSQKASAVQAVYRDYQELQLSRSGLRKIYGITITLALILTALVSVAVALALSSRLSAPLLWLAEGTKALAQGNFRTMQPVHADDELRELTESFNRMTEQLYEAQTRLQSKQDELTANNQFLNSLLGNLSAGVLVLDGQLRLQLFNDGAVRIFERPLHQALGQPLEQVPGLEGFAMAVRANIADHQARTQANGDDSSNTNSTPNTLGPNDNTSWQKHLELPRAFDAQSVRSILLRGSQLPGPNEGHVLVCDDITALISAQRTVAWGEVARRVAHEIKNPLTPIQLSAERLHKKLAPKLEGAELLVLERSTRTIVHQVEALKRMVNDFRDYARLPPAVLKPLCLNELVLDVLALYGVDGIELERGQDGLQGVEVLSQGVHWRVALAENLPKVQGDVSQLRQVIHNLLQNALDASAEHPAPCVDLRTEGLRAPKPSQANPLGSVGPLGCWGVRLVVMDNGHGFKADVLDKAFEPYVTTKTKGTGLGLAIVKKIADEHKARVALYNRNPMQGQTQGAVVELTFPLAGTGAGAETPDTEPNTTPPLA